MILVTGVTGRVGREVARLLGGVRPLRVLARDPGRVPVAGGVPEVVVGDYADRGSLARALEGVAAAFVVTVPGAGGGEDDARFAEAARAAGVRHLVKVSAAAVTDPYADDFITRWQRGAEDVIRSCGVGWTFLRPRSFMSNTLSWASAIRSQGVVRAVHGTSVNACVDPRDVAEVAVRVLTEDGHQGMAYLLTGPEALSAVDQTERLSRVLGRCLRFEELGLGQAWELWSARYPEPVARALLESAERQLAGAKAQVGPAVSEVTGRPARPFGVWAADHAAAFALPAAPGGA
ncbi:NAD(P)H-binding protein [Streptomyces cyaneofuscatus]|uniref:NAD(P)H-binding protein n=1 Tax=Streptomyces cyaneofuscatus TaxID=66883 RepID=UPI003660CE89